MKRLATFVCVCSRQLPNHHISSHHILRRECASMLKPFREVKAYWHVQTWHVDCTNNFEEEIQRMNTIEYDLEATRGQGNV